MSFCSKKKTAHILMFCIIFSDRENHERKERRNYLTTVTQNQTIQTPLKVKYTGHEHQKRGKKKENFESKQGLHTKSTLFDYA